MPHRTRKPAPIIIALNSQALLCARRIQSATPGAEIWGLSGRTTGTDRAFADITATLRDHFREGRAIIAICASGILIRALAPLLGDKRSEPPVLAVSLDGRYVVPLLGGLTGANELAAQIAEALDATAAITAASATRFAVQLEAPPAGYVLANPNDAKAVTGRILAGERINLLGEAPWLTQSSLPIEEKGTIPVQITPYDDRPASGGLLYHPRSVVAIWCANDAAPCADAESLKAALGSANLARAALAAIALPKHAQPASDLMDLACTSAISLRLLRSEEEARDVLQDQPQIIPPLEYGPWRLAIGRQPVDPELIGRPIGRVSVVGIGPGSRDHLSYAARQALLEADDLVGYETYLQMVPPSSPHQTRHGSDNRVELERAKLALDLAETGRKVAVVSSGDPGIFAMASAVMEAYEQRAGPSSPIEVEIIAGISAMQAAAARVGAPLGHDFCAISLSDIRKPWHVIERRLRAAAQGDFTIAIYNPASKSRREQIERARTLLLDLRADATPVIFARDISRTGESCTITTLAELPLEQIDMRTLLIVGSSKTRIFSAPNGRQFVYTPRTYDAPKSE